jgi:hypothetical protein
MNIPIKEFAVLNDKDEIVAGFASFGNARTFSNKLDYSTRCKWVGVIPNDCRKRFESGTPYRVEFKGPMSRASKIV